MDQGISLHSDNRTPTADLNLNNVCRCCMSFNINMNPIFPSTPSKTKQLDQKITFCTGLEVTENDKKPKQICDKCLAYLLIAYDFKMECLTADQAFQQQIEIKKEVTVDIKMEAIEGINKNAVVNDNSYLVEIVKNEIEEENNKENVGASENSKEMETSVVTRTSYNHTVTDQSDDSRDLTDLSSKSSLVTEAQDAVATTSATPFAEPPLIASRKTKAQKQREYRQRIAASRTPAQVVAARKSDAERQRKRRRRKALISGSLKSTTAASSRSKAR